MSWPAPTGDPAHPGRRVAPPQEPAAPAPGVEGSGHVGPGTLPVPNATSQPAPTVTAPPARAFPDPASGQVATVAPPTEPDRMAKINERTGQPVRPWNVWAAAVLLFGAAASVTVGLLLAMWTMASPGTLVGEAFSRPDTFNQATWLTARFPTEESSGWRVVIAIASTVLAVMVAGTASVVGYYAFAGYRWTRIGGLVAVGVTLLSLLLTPIAAVSIGFAALGAGLLWLPATERFFARWHALRNPQVSYSEPMTNVYYGPLPRYR